VSAAAPELTVLTLTLNEAHSLDTFVAKMRPAVSALVPDFEFLIVDGGSTDNTVAMAKAAGARVVQQSKPGYGNAYREGLALSKGEYILTLDADSAHPMEMFAEFWRHRADYSVVMGSRYLPGGSDARPAGRKLLSRVLNFAYRTVLWSPLTDISGGFRLYLAADVQNTPSEALYYDVVAELMGKLWGSGKKILEIPYHYFPRENGESKARILRFGFHYGMTLLKLRLWLWSSASKRA
jgi:glycosyltransferase involved in cell wall biosynthesis